MWLSVAAALLMIGCGRKAADPLVSANVPTKQREGTTETAPKDPDSALYELCRAGNVSLNGAADTIEETLKTAKKARPFAQGD